MTDTPTEPSDEQRAAAELRAVPAATPRPVAEPTRERLAVADQLREAQAQERDRGEDTRRAVGFAVGLAALAAAWRFLGPGRE